MPKKNKDFELFKKEFGKYRRLFGLMGYHIYYDYKPLENVFANVVYEVDAMAATVTLNNNIPPNLQKYKDIKLSAKHEAIHLLLSKLSDYGHNRYISKRELNEAEEELATKLEGLIS